MAGEECIDCSRMGWVVLFGVPFLLAMLPTTMMMDFSHLGEAVAL